METQLNGKTLNITPASFRDALSLQKAIARALKGTDLDLDTSMIDGDGNGINAVITASLSVITSDEVEEKAFKCCERALYDNEKINYDFFEKEENRELYFLIMIEVLKVNLVPFFKGLSSKFSGIKETITNSLKQK